MDQPVFGQGPGYLPPMEQRDYGRNPWGDNAARDASIAQAGVAEGSKNLQGMANQYAAFSAPEPYPSFPNGAGAGSQTAFTAPAASAPMPAQPASVSPWSFQGEALAR